MIAFCFRLAVCSKELSTGVPDCPGHDADLGQFSQLPQAEFAVLLARPDIRRELDLAAHEIV